MKLNTKIIKKLRNSLPTGFGPIIQERLKLKGEEFTLAYIYLVLDPDSPKSNARILDEAISYLEEYRGLQSSMESKILDLV